MSEEGQRDAAASAEAGALKAWVKVGYILLGLSAPVLLEVFFEVVFLTVSSGPQMLFYSIIHTAAGPLGVVLGISLMANPVYALFALGLLAFRSLGILSEPGRHFRIMMVGLGFQAFLLLLLLTYDYWTYALYG